MADRQAGKKKGIADLSEKEKSQQRQKWRERKRDAKAKEKARKEAKAAIPSPPATPTAWPELEPVAGLSRLELIRVGTILI